VKYLVYSSRQPLRNGRTQLRTRVKRVYIPNDARDIRDRGASALQEDLAKHGAADKRARHRLHRVPAHVRLQLGKELVGIVLVL
jgi:hypothetical protein